MRDIFDYCKKHNIHSLAQGMIELPPPELLREILSVIVSGTTVHQYRARQGEEVYRDAIASHLNSEWGAKAVTAANIMATQGVSGGIIASLLYARAKGVKHVGMLQPFYTYHKLQVHSVYGTSGTAECEERSWGSVQGACAFINGATTTIGGVEVEIEVNWEAIASALDDGVGALIVCNPINPSGRVLKEEEVKKMVQMCADKGALLILDECYADLTFGDVTHYCPMHDSVVDNVIVVRGFSKVLGVQSWRVGYVIASEELIAECVALHDPIYISVPITQHAMAVYFKQDADNYAEHRAELKALMWANWEVLAPAFGKAFGWTPIAPEGTMYGCFVHNEKSDMDAVQKALEKGVGICPGGIFYGGKRDNTGLVRIHLGINADKTEDIAKHLLA
eukprot:CAMPEP_0113909934 /NCGR_PEP_ID=MMETSP0780_2-20120614/27182_1 /TAXON_ID=652834 /ORGANISM="Palpitomonas bilix" /LENGTH=392 /DNA_ID=CAMNT_0000905907 /DNA_START=86 /DNA_END=1264 /DNA_ORIENTATION=- /assembly_acc=CAM_ASM_000599